MPNNDEKALHKGSMTNEDKKEENARKAKERLKNITKDSTEEEYLQAIQEARSAFAVYNSYFANNKKLLIKVISQALKFNLSLAHKENLFKELINICLSNSTQREYFDIFFDNIGICDDTIQRKTLVCDLLTRFYSENTISNETILAHAISNNLASLSKLNCIDDKFINPILEKNFFNSEVLLENILNNINLFPQEKHYDIYLKAIKSSKTNLKFQDEILEKLGNDDKLQLLKDVVKSSDLDVDRSRKIIHSLENPLDKQTKDDLLKELQSKVGKNYEYKILFNNENPVKIIRQNDLASLAFEIAHPKYAMRVLFGAITAHAQGNYESLANVFKKGDYEEFKKGLLDHNNIQPNSIPYYEKLFTALEEKEKLHGLDIMKAAYNEAKTHNRSYLQNPSPYLPAFVETIIEMIFKLFDNLRDTAVEYLQSEVKNSTSNIKSLRSSLEKIYPSYEVKKPVINSIIKSH